MKPLIPLLPSTLRSGLLVVWLALAAAGHAQVPTVMSYQGRLQANGTNFNGLGYFRFALLDAGVNTNLTARATAVVNSLQRTVTGITVTLGGSGYVTPPHVTISSTVGSGAKAEATLKYDEVIGIAVTDGGSGYDGRNPPSVIIEPPPVGLSYTVYWVNDTGGPGGRPAQPVEVPVVDGLFSVMLGDTSIPNMMTLPVEVFTHPDVHLRIWFSEDPQGAGVVLSPDQALGSAGYAMMAAQVAAGAITAEALAPGAISSTQLANNAVNSAKLAAGSVTTSHLVDRAVTVAKLGNAAVGNAQLADGAVTTVKLADATVSSSKLADASISNIKLADGAVTGGKLSASAVTSDKLGNASVTSGKLASGAVTSAAIENGTITSADLDLTELSTWFWRTDGNAGTWPGAQFVGTKDNRAFEVKVNNARALHLEPGIESPNLIGGYSNNNLDSNLSGVVIGGGGSLTNGINFVRADFATIGGGAGGTISADADFATIGGGRGNIVQADAAFAVIAGGRDNQIRTNAVLSVIGGGAENLVTNDAIWATIGGGDANWAVGSYAMLPGGTKNTAGKYCLAAGRRAKATHIGSFVWADSANEDFSTTASQQFLIRAAGGVGINTTQPQSALDVNGETTTKVLTITGGADVAEPFPVAGDDIPAGALVTIDPTTPGQLVLSAQAYDKRVAGIVSGANGVQPGLTLRQTNGLEGGRNIALTGRVYALADAGNGAIEPGDLLTTSDTPGHAMKATDATRAQGAIVGKAMSSLNQGRGFVLVLVSLQ